MKRIAITSSVLLLAFALLPNRVWALTPCSSLVECRNDWLSPNGQYGQKNKFDIYSDCQFLGSRGPSAGITCNNNPDEKKKMQEEQLQKALNNQSVGDSCNFADNNKIEECRRCMLQPPSGEGGAWTAIGCIPTEPKAFIQKFITFGAGLAGGIAFLLILFGGFQVMTSTGNPEKLNAGKELVVSALTGLILVIFSILLLKIIGYNILGIPGFG